MIGFDEMKIREGLVFDNVTGNIIGYVETGDMNSMLSSFESRMKGEQEIQEIATHMLVVCVRGIFMKLDYPLGQFATTSTFLSKFTVLKLLSFTAASGQQLYDIVWTAIRRLMIIGLEVVVVVADGASSNRKFFNLHKDVAVMQGGVNYKVKNMYDLDKYVIHVFMYLYMFLLILSINCRWV